VYCEEDDNQKISGDFFEKEKSAKIFTYHYDTYVIMEEVQDEIENRCRIMEEDDTYVIMEEDGKEDRCRMTRRI
jgi:hypothetical protein